MKIVKANAGALTNSEVLDFLNARGASKDTTTVIAPIARSEWKVYDCLVEFAAFTQTREIVTEFTEKCKEFKLVKAEILNIINLRPSSIVELMPRSQDGESTQNVDGCKIVDKIVELVQELLVPLPTPEIHEENDEEEAENGEQAENATEVLF